MEIAYARESNGSGEGQASGASWPLVLRRWPGGGKCGKVQATLASLMGVVLHQSFHTQKKVNTYKVEL